MNELSVINNIFQYNRLLFMEFEKVDSCEILQVVIQESKENFHSDLFRSLF